MIQVNRIYLIFNRLVTKKFLVDTSDPIFEITDNARMCRYTEFAVFAAHSVVMCKSA